MPRPCAKHDREGLSRALFFLGMLGCFFAGGVLSTLACHLVSAKAIWLNLLPLGVVLVRLVHADLTEEKGLLSQKPAAIKAFCESLLCSRRFCRILRANRFT